MELLCDFWEPDSFATPQKALLDPRRPYQTTSNPTMKSLPDPASSHRTPPHTTKPCQICQTSQDIARQSASKRGFTKGGFEKPVEKPKNANPTSPRETLSEGESG